jgi:hypothetical protein
MIKRLLLLLGCALALGTAYAGSRARYGGTLSICVVGTSTETDPLLADSPTEAASLLLTRTPLCRLAELSRPSPLVLRLTMPPGLPPSKVVPVLERVRQSTGPTRALLSQVTRIAENGRSVELTNAPVDLERALCHPAFSVPFGPFKGTGGQLAAVAEQPDGRPYLDSVTVTLADARLADRLLQQHKVQVVLGSNQADDSPQLFMLALVFSPALAPHLRTALDATIDRGDLVKFFVRPPSAPLPSLLPVALGGATAQLPRPARPAALSPPREVTLLFDAAAGDERAIAERLQVKLQPLGYRVALHGLPRSELRAHTPLENELMLVGLLLPPSPSFALAMIFEAAGQRARIAPLLQGLPSVADADARAAQLATAALAELPLWPVATRGLGITTSREVQHLSRDALGLPRLDDVFLSTE